MKSHLQSLLIGFVGLLFLTLGTSWAAANGPGTGPSFKGPVGLQLYSLRAQIKRDAPGTLDQIKSWGIQYVEVGGDYQPPSAQYVAELHARGLKPISAHFSFEKYRDDLDSIVQEAKLFGLHYVGCAWIPHEGPFDEKTCRAAAVVFNRAGQALARHGLKFFYHTHGYEFQPHGNGTLFDLLMAETNPKYVAYQMDIFWIVHPGQDPVKLFERYGARWQLVHLKDMKRGTPTGLLSGGSDVTNDVPLGTGEIDMPAVLRAARKAGVKWYFIEDESPTSEKQIPESLRYLERVKF